MASTTLYPPIVDSYIPAFIASGNSASCRLYYSLSKFSSSVKNIKSIHISIVNQISGKSVINPINNTGSGRYRATGIIILNAIPIPVEGQENLYYTDILNEDIINGWTAGWKYKIQVRFGEVAYSDEIGQAAWLNVNANRFSEWSTYSITKAIGQPTITISNFGYNSAAAGSGANRQNDYVISDSTLEFSGAYSNEADSKEVLYSYQLRLLNDKREVVESSDLIYANQYVPNQFYYLFKTEFKNEDKYRLELTYETENKFIEVKNFDFEVIQLLNKFDGVELLTAEAALMKPYSSVEEENNDGRIALKLYSDNKEKYFGNICLRRADSKTNFTVWTDIKMFVITNENINDVPIFYDYTVESGVWYKYGIQSVDTDGFRSVLKEIDPIKREFEYSFLLGENNHQLRLSFDNTMNSFRHSFSESKVDTIGSKYPYITRNGNTNYKTFPINGLISFVMDLDNLFTTEEDIYKYSEIVKLYNRNKEIKEYEYTYERDFRNKVLEFLQDGKPKLFKSPTEGNVLVRLMDINTSPNTTLGRLIYSFSSNAYEIDDATMENYFKYNFYSIEEYDEELIYTETRFGSLQNTETGSINIKVGSDLFKMIADKYYNPSILGNTETVVSIRNLSLEFYSEPMAIYNNAGELVSGYNLLLNDESKITVYDRNYDFDELLSFSPSESLIILGDNDDTNDENEYVSLRADFIYDVAIQPKKERGIKQKSIVRNIGQVLKPFYPNDSIYSEVYYKYFYNWDDSFRHLSELDCVSLEANPGTVFTIKDSNDIESEEHVIGPTGVLNLNGLGVGGVKDVIYKYTVDIDGNRIDDDTKSTDILVDYIYYLTEGIYKGGK